MFEKLMIALALYAPAFEPTTVCSVEGGDGGGGGTGDPPPKTFTQEEVNRIAAREKAQGEAKAKADAEAAFKAKEAEHLARIAELELAGKTEAEKREIERKQREDADKKAREDEKARLTKERDDEKAARVAAEARWKNDRVNTAVTSALIANKAVATAIDDAALAFGRAAKIETDEEGQIANVIYAGKSHPKLDDAIKEFLKEKSHFAQPVGTNGGGTRSGGNNGGNGSGNNGQPLMNLSREELLARTAAKDAATGRKQ